MKIINLDELKSESFYLGDVMYVYKVKKSDKEFYRSSLINLNKGDENIEKLISIFTQILEKQNKFVFIKKEDVVGLFNFFNSRLL